MRICLVIAGLGGGGAERMCINLANAWLERGSEPTILTISQNARPPAYSIDSRVELRDIGWPREPRSHELSAKTIAPILRGIHAARCPELLRDSTIIALLRYAILATEPDVVVSFIDRTNIRVVAAMHESGVPVIVCEVTDPRRISLRGWERARGALYSRAAVAVALDPAIAEWFRTRGIRGRSIPVPLVAPKGLNRVTNDSRRRIVTLSRLSREKSPELLLRAFASLAERFLDWDLEFYGIGPQQNFLEHLAEDLALRDRIHFRGFTNDPYGVLARTDIFVSASWVEGFSNAIWEALACGVPVVATNSSPATRALVRHEVDGLIVPVDNVGALAAALERLMSDEAERQSFASRAPEVVERFSMESVLKQWDALLAGVLVQSPRSVAV